MKSRHSNLTNPNSEPERAPVVVQCTVHYDMGMALPKEKLQRWLASLPEHAKVEFTGIANGKPHFRASWEETR